MDFLKTRGISHLNWAVNDKREGASALKPGSSTKGGWSAEQLTESGTFVRKIVSGWEIAAPVVGANAP
jgi:endoglucanase